MLFDAAASEIPLLLFTLLVPTGLMGLALIACVRGFFSDANATENAHGARMLDRLSLVPVGVVLVGLVASVFHVGSPEHIPSMLLGVGTSPLSNEILVAGISIVVAVVYGVLACVKPQSATAHKVFGVALGVLSLLTAVFTGLAYLIPTVITWGTPYGITGQLALALLGGGVLAATMIALSGFKASKSAHVALAAAGVVGCVLLAATLVLQGGVAQDAMSSTGATLAAVMGDYTTVAVVAVVCAVVGLVLWGAATLASKGGNTCVALGLVLVFVALVCTRIDFYGIFLSVGLG